MIDILRVFRPFLFGLTVVLSGTYFLLVVHVAGSIKGGVVDQASGRPIEGAIVVVSWSINETFFFGSVNVGQVHVNETLTDKNGAFSFKSWIDIVPLGYSVNSSRPQVLVAKPGYMPMWMGEERSSRQELGKVIEDQGNEKLLFMMSPPSDGLSADAFAMQVTFLGQKKPRFISSAGVLQKHAPYMSKYLDEYAHTGVKR